MAHVDDDPPALAHGPTARGARSNTACRNSEAAAAQLRSLGYTNVRKYAEGKQGCREARLPLESAVRA